MRNFFVPAAVFLAALLVPLGLSLRANDGHFVYTLDDPYIHLALSENIAAGHYGINGNENTAPSSSILWPFLLAPFSSFPFFQFVPFLLNTAFALLTILVLSRFFGADGLIFTVASVFVFNIVGLVFTGMEHSLQLLLVVVITHELTRASGKDGFVVSPLLALAVVLAPVVRYECLAVSVPVLLFVFAAGERKKALILFAIMAVLLLIFSLFLVSLGLSPLPASVNAKSAVLSESGSLGSVPGNLVRSLSSFRGVVQLLLLIPLGVVLFSSRRDKTDRLLAGVAVCSVVLHLMVGRSGWFHRYAVYVWAFSVLVVFQLYREYFVRFRVPAILVLLFASADYLSGYTKIAYASNNVYSQQYQVRRFVHNWLNEPVAVNDLGLVSMDYENYVLDLWGLATPAALQGAADAVWVDSVAMANGVNTAVVYLDEISGIQHWTRVARMEIPQPLVVCVDDGVDFLAAPWVSPDRLTDKLESFSGTLPDGVSVVFFREKEKL